ncbi:MAG: hypothetical protein PSX81_01960 [bacterium]|nr:hypothetical protein [bacterium]
MRMLKLLTLLIIIGNCFCNPLLARQDSTKSIQLIIATYNFGFNKVVSSTIAKTNFFYNEVAPLKSPAIGANFHLQITYKKNMSIELLYSHASIGYHYTAPNANTNNFSTTGHIKMNGWIMNTQMQYKVFDWMKINYGLGHYFNSTNTFDSLDIAEAISWNTNGISNMKTYTLALAVGAEFKLYKRLSLEINTNRGLTNFVILNLKADPTVDFPMKMGFTGLSLNYRIW